MERSERYSAFMQYGEVLVTGGTGFLGRHVCRALVARGHLPRLLVREGSEDKIPEELRHACRVTPGDVTDRDSVENAAQGTQAIVHLAGILREDPGAGETYERVHVRGTRNVVHAARRWGISRLVHVGVLGARAGDPSGYFASKGRGEEIVRNSDLRWTVLRPAPIFGTGDAFLSRLEGILRGSPVFPVPGPGDSVIQPVHAGDVAQGVAEALSRPETEATSFDVGGPEVLTVDDLIDAVAAASGRRVRKVHLPLALARAFVRRLERYERFSLPAAALEILNRDLVCDVEPFRKAFGIGLLPLGAYLAPARGPAVLPRAPGKDVPAPSSSPGPGEKVPSLRKSA